MYFIQIRLLQTGSDTVKKQPGIMEYFTTG